MGQQSETALETLDRLVFKGPEPIVVSLTAGWGAGKSYFWRTKVLPRYGDDPHFKEMRPGYVSVFGVDSLSQIRERVVLARIIDSTNADKKSLLAQVKAEIPGVIRNAIDKIGGKIGISEGMATELLERLKLDEGWVICIDDVERLSESVGFDAFLGYVTELRDLWKLKVVLIFNSQPLVADPNSVFRNYEEKVIDRNIPFALDPTEIIPLVFGKNQVSTINVLAEAQPKVAVLNITNIRILVKTRRYFEEIASVVGQDADADFMRQLLGSLLLFTYVKFSNEKPEKLTFEYLKKYSRWGKQFRKAAGVSNKQEETDPELAEVDKMLDDFGYESTDEVDQFLINYVQSDVMKAVQVQKLYAVFVSEAYKRRVDHKFNEVWEKLYHGTFRDNRDELCEALDASLVEYLPFIPPLNLDSALDVLTKCGRKDLARERFNRFLEMRRAQFESLDRASLPHGYFSYKPLRKFMAGLVKSGNDMRSIDEVMQSVTKNGLVTMGDSARLNEFSVQALVDYVSETDQPRLTKKLLALTNTQNPELKAKMSKVIRKLVSKNKLNRMRVEGIGIPLETKKTTPAQE